VDGLVPVQNGPGVRKENAGNEVEKGGLAGAVGPMIALMVPSRTAKVTSLTACSPPKERRRLETSSRAMSLSWLLMVRRFNEISGQGLFGCHLLVAGQGGQRTGGLLYFLDLLDNVFHGGGHVLGGGRGLLRA